MKWNEMANDLLASLLPRDKRSMLYFTRKKQVGKRHGVVGGPIFPFLFRILSYLFLLEPIYVEVELTNPLAVALQFTELRLLCSVRSPSLNSSDSIASPRASTAGSEVDADEFIEKVPHH